MKTSTIRNVLCFYIGFLIATAVWFLLQFFGVVENTPTLNASLIPLSALAIFDTAYFYFVGRYKNEN